MYFHIKLGSLLRQVQTLLTPICRALLCLSIKIKEPMCTNDSDIRWKIGAKFTLHMHMYIHLHARIRVRVFKFHFGQYLNTSGRTVK